MEHNCNEPDCIFKTFVYETEDGREVAEIIEEQTQTAMLIGHPSPRASGQVLTDTPHGVLYMQFALKDVESCIRKGKLKREKLKKNAQSARACLLQRRLRRRSHGREPTQGIVS